MAVELEGLQFSVEGISDGSAKELESLAEALSKLKSALPGKSKIKGFTSAIEALGRATSNLNTGTIKDLSNAISSLGSSKISSSIGRNIEKIGTAARTITDSDVSRIRELGDALSGLRDIGNINIHLPSRGVGDASENPAGGDGWVDVESNAEQAQGAVRSFFSTVVSGAGTAAGAVKAIAGGFATVGRAAGKVGGAIMWLPKFFTKDMVSGVGKAIGSVKTLFAGLARIATYRLLRTAIKLFTEAMTTGLKNVYAYSQLVGTSFASNLDLIATNALYLKNSLGAMVSPLINAVAPAVDFVTGKFVDLFNVVNMFFARLTGADTATIAKKTFASWGDEADSSAGRVKKAVDELKRTILGFDELNVLNGQDEDAGGSGGGAGGGGTDAGSMFEQVPIEQSVSEFADRLKAAFEAGEWNKLGTIIGEKFNDIVNSVPWDTIGTKIGTGIDAAIKVAYGALTAANFTNLGSKFVTLVNNALTAIDTETLGKLVVKRFTVVADLIIGAITDLNWGLIASKASDYVIGIFSELSTWLQSVSWSSLTTSLYNNLKSAITSVKYAEIASAISEAFGSAVGAILSVIATIGKNIGTDLLNGIKGVFTNIKTWIKDNVITPFKNGLENGDVLGGLADAGKNIILGVFNGIVSFFTGIGTWVKTNIFDPFVKGFKATFGIASPASNPDIVDLGKQIIVGIFNGIVNWMKGVGTWFKTNVLDKIVEKWNEFWANPIEFAGAVVDLGVSLVKSGWDTLTGWFNGLPTSVKDAVANIKAGLIKGWDTLSGWFTGLKEKVPLVNAVSGGIAKAWDTLKGWFNGLGESPAAINVISGGIKKAWDSIGGWFDKLTNKSDKEASRNVIIGGIAKAWSTISKWWDGLGSDSTSSLSKDLVSVKLRQAWSTIENWWNNSATGKSAIEIADKIKLKLSQAWSTIENWWNNTATGKAAIEVADKIKMKLKEAWTSIQDWWNNSAVGTAAIEVADKIKLGLSRGWNSIKEWWNGLKKGVAGISVNGKIGLNLSRGWNSIKEWWNGLKKGVAAIIVGGKVKLNLSRAWTSIKDWWGSLTKGVTAITVNGKIGLALKRAWTTISSWWSHDVPDASKAAIVKDLITAKLVKGWSTIQHWFNEITTGSPYTRPTVTIGTSIDKSGYSGKSGTFAKGGAFYAGRWHNIPQYAEGAILPPSHGSLFIAGEAGPEVVGHVGGRTEVLNASQLAAAVHSAVLSAMQQANANNSAQNPVFNITVRTESDEVLARAVTRGQRSLDARLSPT